MTRITKKITFLFLILIAANVNAQYTLKPDDVEFDSQTGTIVSYKWPEHAGTSIIIPDKFNGISVQIIGILSFYNLNHSVNPASGLTELVIPNSVTHINQSAFQHNKISSLNLGNKLTYIGKNAFSNNNITNLSIPNGVDVIDNYAFAANNINQITFPKNLKIIQYGVFRSNNLTQLNLPLSLETIETDAFGNNNIKEISLPISVTSLSGFRENNFTHITIPSHVKTIGSDAFSQNPLTSVTINNGVEHIGESAFWTGTSTPSGPSSLKSAVPDIQGTVSIPSSVKYIGASAFRGNTNLTKIILNEGLISIGDRAFLFCGLTDVQIPSTVRTIDGGAFSVNKLKTITLPEGLEELKDGAFAQNQLTTVTIPGTVKRIGSKAFYGNSSMSTIQINEGVEIIGTECFSYNQSISNISIPTSLLEIEEKAFFNSFFVSITLPIPFKQGKKFSHWATYSGNAENTLSQVVKFPSNENLGYIAVFTDISTGIDTERKDNLIFTNPVNDFFKIYLSGSLEIYDLTGKKVLGKTINSNQLVDLSYLPKGIYVFVMNQTERGKIIKQ